MIEPAILNFVVPGVPVPQGSKSAIPTAGGVRIVEGNRAKLRPWRAAVAIAAGEAMAGAPLLGGPLELVAAFYFPRPKSHYGTGRNGGQLKPGAPFWLATRPDVEKLARALADALTGVVYRDDSQVARWSCSKRYDETPRADVTVWKLEP